MLTLLPNGEVSKKLINTFLIEDFFICHHAVSTTLVVYLELWMSPQICEKFEMAQIVYSGAQGKLIHEKNLKSKISWHCPFKGIYCSVPLPSLESW